MTRHVRSLSYAWTNIGTHSWHTGVEHTFLLHFWHVRIEQRSALNLIIIDRGRNIFRKFENLHDLVASPLAFDETPFSFR